jgi:hypothetical protein
LKEKQNINPYTASLREHLRKLRIELLFLLNQWYYLKSISYPEVKHRYRNLFGDLVFDLDDKKMTAFAMDSRLREIIAKINTNKQVSQNYVVNTYNLKFNTQTHVNPVSDDYDIFEVITNEFHNKYIPECDINTEYELVQLYRQIVKRVHPDINGDNETFNKYWNNIQDAYQSRNLTRMRLFHKLICEEIPDEFADIRSEEFFLKSQIQQLEKSINIEKQKISRVKSEEPFCYEEKINDPKWIRHKRTMLSSEIKLTEQIILRNKSVLKKIMENSKDKLIA